MADYYADHGAYAANGVIGAAIPITWGVPQEGDGSGKYAASASSIALIRFSAVPTAGVVSVCGVSVVTTGVIGADSADAAANALATNINATTTAVAAGVCGGLPALKNLAYARGPAGGAPSGTCQVMLRVGSEALNYANNTNCLLATTLNNESSTAADKQFAGGIGGCWGWFINDVVVGGASATYAAGGFGLITGSKPFASVAAGTSILAEPTPNDTTWGRSREGQTITLPVNVTNSVGSAFHLNFVLDSNTQWAEDSGDGVVTISQAIVGANIAIASGPPITHVKSIGCIIRGKLRYYLRSAASGGVWGFSPQNVGGSPWIKLWNLLIEESDTLPLTQGFAIYTIGAYAGGYLEGVQIKLPAPRIYWSMGGLVNSGLTGTLILSNCEVTANFTSVLDPGPIVTGNITGGKSEIRLSGCSFIGWPSGKFRPFALSSGAAFASLVVENCTGLRIDSSTYIGLPSNTVGQDEFSSRFIYQSAEEGLSFRDEHRKGICDWVYGAGYPTCRAVQPDGTPWCIKMEWMASPFIVTEAFPFRSIPLGIQYREVAAQKRIEVELYIPDSISITSMEISMSVVYISNVTGRACSVGTKAKGGAYIDSTAIWEANDASGYSAKKLTAITPDAIKEGTTITVYIELHRAAPGINRQLYLDPEFSVLAL